MGDVDFILIAEGKELGNKGSFINFLIKYWSDKVRVGKETLYGHEIIIKKSRDSMDGMFFYLNVAYDEKKNVSGLSFSTESMDQSYHKDPVIKYSNNPDILLFYEIFFEACKYFGPTLAYADETKDDERPCMDWAEYYKDPFLFCLEPPLFISGEKKDDLDRFFNDFIRNKNVIAKLNEIKKVMSRDKLIDLIKKYSGQIKYSGKFVESDDGGVGILKNDYPQAAYPRYFIRRELRKRGIQLEDGLAEKYAKKLKMEEE